MAPKKTMKKKRQPPSASVVPEVVHQVPPDGVNFKFDAPDVAH